MSAPDPPRPPTLAGPGPGLAPRCLLAACGPLSLLAASFILVAGGLTIRGLPAAATGVAVELLVIPALAGRTGVPVLRLLPGLLGVASVIWSNWLLSPGRDWAPALGAGLRVAFFVLPGLVFASYLDPSAVGDHLGQRLRLPARPTLAFVAALQRLESLGQEWADLERARRVRGLGPGRGPVSRGRHYVAMLFALLVSAVRQAGRMTVAMEARGYSAARASGGSRTWAEPAPWRWPDTTVVAVAVGLALVPVVAGTWLSG